MVPHREGEYVVKVLTCRLFVRKGRDKAIS